MDTQKPIVSTYIDFHPNSRPKPPLPSLFHTIPPERVGLDGEYDHHGLVKRVCQAFAQCLDGQDLGSIVVTQRGAIVELRGRFEQPTLLCDLIMVALQTEGAVGVEVNGKTIFPQIDRNRLFSQVMTLCSIPPQVWNRDMN